MKAYTLIELIISILLLSIVLLGGTTLFYQSLKATGLSDVDSNLNNSLQTILRGMEKDIRFGQVTGVEAGTRPQCLSAGEAGLPGSVLDVTDLNGHGSIYSLVAGKIASTSAETSQVVYLNSDQITIDSLLFTWSCQGGVNDKIRVEIVGSSNILNSGVNITKEVSAEINLLNSGLN